MKKEYLWNPLYNTVMDLKNKFMLENNIKDITDICKKIENSEISNIIEYMCNHVKESDYYVNIFMPLFINEYNGCVLFKYGEFNLQRDAEKIGGKDFFDLYDGLYRYCRSIVIDIVNDELVIAPFKKFFNINQLEECSYDVVVQKCEKAISNNKNVEFSNKLDGSMMNVRFYNDSYFISSSTNIDKSKSWRTTDAYSMLINNKNLCNMIKNNPTKTHVFEYVSLKDVHVVKYDKSQEGLYLIGLVDNYTGEESSYKDVIDYANKYHVLTTEIYDKDIHTIMDELKDKKSNEAEGFVINIDGEKFKLKYDDYVKMHKILSTLQSQNLTIEMIATDKFDDYISKVPMEYRDRIFETADLVFNYIDTVEDYMNFICDNIPDGIKNNKSKACKYIDDNTIKPMKGLVIRKYLNEPYNILITKNGKIPNLNQILKNSKAIIEIMDNEYDRQNYTIYK